jgi:cob(I)alamin adenosyltransferase
MTEARVYTRRGDDGTTGLLYGGRVPKDSPAPMAYGDVDEAQAAIGLARAAAGPEMDAILVGLECDLWLVMAELACSPDKVDQLGESGSRPTSAMVTALEGLIDDVSERFDPPTEFVVPGEDEVSARLDVARTVCRRAERSALSVAADGSSVVSYLNRLSDLLWILARWQEGGSLTARSVADRSATD